MGDVQQEQQQSSTAYKSKLWLSDEELLKRGVPKEQVELCRRDLYRSSFGIDTWYPALKDSTFRTISFPLSVEEAKGIVAIHHSRYTQKELFVSDVPEVLALQKKIDNALKENFPGGAFIKLDTRSPKDVSIDDNKDVRTQELLREEVEALRKANRTVDENSIVEAFVKATNRRRRLTTGEEAVRILVRSERVTQDLSTSLQFANFHWTPKIILREWNEYIVSHPEREFRAFVHNNQLNAITQYFSFIYFPWLEENKSKVLKQIQSFFEEAKSLIPHENYVVDFFVYDDRVYVIELNPFHIGAGAGLFSWRADRELFFNGPLEFRICDKSVIKDCYSYIPTQWQKHIKAQGYLDPESSCPSLLIPLEVSLSSALIVAAIGAYLYWRRYNKS